MSQETSTPKYTVKVFSQDAKSHTPGKPSKGRWFPAILIEGKVEDLSDRGQSMSGVTVKFLKWYYDAETKKMYEAWNTEKFYYARQVRNI